VTMNPDVQLADALPEVAFDVDVVRQDFPALHQRVNDRPLVYLDNAATTHKPQQVIDALVRFYSQDNSNVHRGAHTLSDRATVQFEAARVALADFIHARASEEIVWTSGTTEGINLVAQCYGGSRLKAGDRILVSEMAHHSNIVPWQMVAERTGAEVVPIPVTALGEIDQAQYQALLDERVKIVAIGHVSNALGTINPVASMVEHAHAVGAVVLVDGAQAVGHWAVDMQALDCDFYVFSGHKMFGPTGIGVLYGRQDLLEAMPPYMGGGEMIESVSFSETVYNTLPYKFEAGTPNIADAIGLHAAVDYLGALDRVGAQRHEEQLLARADSMAADCEGLEMVGGAPNRTGVLSFNLQGAHPSDIGMLLDQQGVAVRTGHHCAQPIMDQLTRSGTVRASFSFYNTQEDVELLFAALAKATLFLQ